MQHEVTGPFLLHRYALNYIKYEKHCQKMYRDVGMAVPKLQKLGVEMAVCRQDMLYKDYTTNPIPTFFFGSKIALPSNLVA